MRRPGGINFCSKKSGGYKPRATHEVGVNLPFAVADGYTFFENRFSGLIFGVGKWNQGRNWWNGNIPWQYLAIKRR